MILKGTTYLMSSFINSIDCYITIFVSIPLTLAVFFTLVLSLIAGSILFVTNLFFGNGLLPILPPLVILAIFYVVAIPAFSWFRRKHPLRIYPLKTSLLGSPSVDIVGGKAAGLLNIITLGDATPEGFVISSRVFNEIILSCHGDVMEMGIDHAREIVDSAEFSKPFMRQLARSLRSLGSGQLIVRSSFPDEDTPSASFAGIYMSIKNVPASDPESLIRAIIEVWKSYWTEEAELYRKNVFGGNTQRLRAPGVVVQRQADVLTSGLAFSCNIRNGFVEEQIVELYRGDECSSVVKNTLNGSLKVMQGFDLEESDVETVERLSQLLMKYEAYYGRPIEMEWGLENGSLLLFQVRPVTAFEPVKTLTNSYIADLVPYPLTPLSESVALKDGRLDAWALLPFKAMGFRLKEDGISEKHDGLWRVNYNILRDMYNPYLRLKKEYSVVNELKAFRFIHQTLKLLSKNAKQLSLTAGLWDPAIYKKIAEASSREAREEFIRLREQELLPAISLQQRTAFVADFLGKYLKTFLLRILSDEDGNIAAVIDRALSQGEESFASQTTNSMERLLKLLQENRNIMDVMREKTSLKLKWRRISESGDPAIKIFSNELMEYLRLCGLSSNEEAELSSLHYYEQPEFALENIYKYALEKKTCSPANNGNDDIVKLLRKCSANHLVRWEPLFFRFLYSRYSNASGLRWRLKHRINEINASLKILALGIAREVEAYQAGEGLPDAIFFITYEELLSGEYLTSNKLHEKIKERAREYVEEKKNQSNPVLHIDANGMVLKNLSLETGNAGLGISPGVAEGPMLEISSPEDTMFLEDGVKYILHVPDARASFSRYFPHIAGLLIGSGAALGHLALLAREMGVPTIVGVGIPGSNGEIVRMDGMAGTVKTTGRKIG